MKKEILNHYKKLVCFLGDTLGQDYEIGLYDLENGNNSLLVSSKTNNKSSLENELPTRLLNLLSNGGFFEKDYLTNLPGKQNTVSVYRNSYMLIKDSDGIINGLLCIIFDDTRFTKLHDYLLSVAHPLDFIKNHSFHTVHNLELFESDSNTTGSAKNDMNSQNLQNLMNTCYRDAIRSANIYSDRFTQEERLIVIKYLKEYGFFRMKAAVSYAAEHLGCSTASIYRYLSELKE